MEPDLCTKDLSIGGVYVFDLNRFIDSNSVDLPDLFVANFEELKEIHRIEKGLLDEEHFILNTFKVKVMGVDIKEIQLSSGRKLNIKKACFYLSICPMGICSIVFRFDIDQRVKTDSIIELVSIVNGSISEEGGKEQKICINFDSTCFLSFKDFFLHIEGIILDEANSNDVTHRYNKSHIHPIVFIKSTEGNEVTSDDIVAKYKGQLAGIKHLWIKKWRYLKESLILEDIEQESHPLYYGYTYFSPICTVEIHPKLVRDAALIQSRTISEHYFIEWFSLSKVLEIVSIQYFVFRKYDYRLYILQKEILFNLSGIKPLQLLRNLKRVSRERQQILLDVHDFWNIKIAKKSYVQKLFEEAKSNFLLDNLFTSIQNRIESLDELLNNNYQIYMAVTNTIIAIVMLCLTVLTLFGSNLTSKKSNHSINPPINGNTSKRIIKDTNAIHNQQYLSHKGLHITTEDSINTRPQDTNDPNSTKG